MNRFYALAKRIRLRRQKNHDTERSQAVVRLILTPLFTLYVADVSWVRFDHNNLVVFLYCSYHLVALGLYVWIRIQPGIVLRRVLSIAADYSITTTFLVLGQEAFLPCYALLLWITVGNGIRFGTRYLIATTILALACLMIPAVYNPYWRANPYLIYTLMLTTILVPAYVLVLLSRVEAAYQAAMEANRAKSQFLAQASHDLRQPIHAMSLFTACLRDNDLEPDERAMVDNIDRSIESLSRLFRSLLDISTLDSGKVAVRPEIVAIADIFQEIERQNQLPAHWAGVELRFRYSQLHVFIDRSLITTVLQNVVSNAIKYAAGRPVLIGCRRQGQTLTIAVYDRGDGIAEHHLPLLCKEFYRVRERGDRDVDGVGLGLAIVERLTSLMGLNVAIRSVRQRGTSVAIRGLPISGPPDPRKRFVPLPKLANPSALAGLRVLLVEDDLDVLCATQSLLERWGCIVHATPVVPKTTSAHDLIITDYDLGNGVTGTECIDMARKMIGADVPAIVLTGHDAGRLREELMDPQIPILLKPVRPAELRSNLLAIKTRTAKFSREGAD